jgi:hypothetical protein
MNNPEETLEHAQAEEITRLRVERDRLREEVIGLKEVMRGAGCPKTITAYRTV